MKNLFHQRWFKPTLFILLLFLQLGFLFTTAFLRPVWTETESGWLALAQSPVSGMEQDSSNESEHQLPSVLDHCISWGVPPLYPLLLRWLSGILPEGFRATITPGILNLLLFAASWVALYFASQGLIRNSRDAALIPLLYGFSAGAALTVRTCGPYMLALFFASLMLFLLTALQNNPQGKLLHAVLFLTVLGGFLTIYAFLLLALAAGIAYACYCIARRRRSGMATTLVTSASALLTGIILYPACIEHLAANTAAFALSYPARMNLLYAGLSNTLFGGFFSAVLALSALLLAAVLFFRTASPKRTAPPVLSLAGKREEASNSAKTQSVQTEDPAKAAYRRRIARRTETPAKFHFTLSQDTACLVLVSGALLFYFLLLPFSHNASLSSLPFVSLKEQTAPLQELCWPLYPWFYFLFSNLLYRCIPAIGGNHKAVILLISGVFLSLSVISFTVCRIFSQPLTVWLFSI